MMRTNGYTLLYQGQLHVDMVKFALPVKIQEVRVVPHNVRVHSSFSVDRIG